MKIKKYFGITSILASLLFGFSANASYPITARHLTWDESYTLHQCSTKACMADDLGTQYINTCSQYVNEDGTTTLIMVVLFSKIYGDDCYCPCVGYFIEEVKKQSTEPN